MGLGNIDYIRKASRSVEVKNVKRGFPDQHIRRYADDYDGSHVGLSFGAFYVKA